MGRNSISIWRIRFSHLADDILGTTYLKLRAAGAGHWRPIGGEGQAVLSSSGDSPHGFIDGNEIYSGFHVQITNQATGLRNTETKSCHSAQPRLKDRPWSYNRSVCWVVHHHLRNQYFEFKITTQSDISALASDCQPDIIKWPQQSHSDLERNAFSISFGKTIVINTGWWQPTQPWWIIVYNKVSADSLPRAALYLRQVRQMIGELSSWEAFITIMIILKASISGSHWREASGRAMMTTWSLFSFYSRNCPLALLCCKKPINQNSFSRFAVLPL